MLGANGWIFMQFLSATMLPPVDLVSAPTTTPSLKMAPQMVVPVLVVLGADTLPLLIKNAFLERNKNVNQYLILSYRVKIYAGMLINQRLAIGHVTDVIG